ncbi:hypothetical protein [Micromonospora sp. NPDC047740]|uniref:hypothetical protein n=1 Tax=Micromonospora sp. NPDC047740 TaxID=3364254 RepID=UPI00371A2666
MISDISSLAAPAGSGASGSHGLISDTTVTIVIDVVMGLSVLAETGALVLLSLPASARYFRRRRSVRQPSDPVVDQG